MSELTLTRRRAPVRLIRGQCATPRCEKAAGSSGFCVGCWWDLEPDERAALTMAQRSPLFPDLARAEAQMALLATAGELHHRRRIRAAKDYMRRRVARSGTHKGPWS